MGIEHMAYLRVVATALVIWVALLNTGVSYAADKITLTCSGTRLESPPVSLAFIIDQDQGIVTPLTEDNKPGPPASITENTERRISFKALGNNGEVVAEGVIDRYSGSAIISVGADKFTGTCKPAKPLF